MTVSTFQRERTTAPSSASSAAGLEIGWRTVLPFFAFVALLLVRTLGMTHHSLWFDEGYTYNLVNTQSLHDFLHLFASYTVSEHLQPLYYLVMYGWTRIAGTSDAALRLPSALFSVLSGVTVYIFARRLVSFHSVIPAMALLGFTASSYSVYYAQEARPYALLQLLAFVLIALWTKQWSPLASVYERRSTAGKVGLCAVAVLCSVASPFTALLVAVLAAADAATVRNVRRWMTVWLWPAAVALPTIGGYLLLLQRRGMLHDAHTFVALRQPLWMNVPYLFNGLMFGLTLPPGSQALHEAGKLQALRSALPVLLLCAIAVVSCALALVRMARRALATSRLTRSLSIAVALYATLLFLGFGWMGRLNLLPRHGSALFALLVAMAVLWCTGARKQPTSPILLLATTSIVLCNVISLWGYFARPDFLKDDYRSTAVLLTQGTSVPTYLVAGQPSLLRHYGASAVDATNVEPTELSHFLQTHSGDGTVRLVVNRYRGYRWDSAASPAVMLQARYDCRPEARFSYMDVELCKLHGATPQTPIARGGQHAR